MRTKYVIDDFQQTYFVIESFEALLEACYRDFGNVYAEVRDEPDFEAHSLTPADRVITPGSLAYFKAAGGRG
jgi:phenylalanine-4-hydroxylase